jgi:uncharacterized protein YndB with AHSA1/START domain
LRKRWFRIPSEPDTAHHDLDFRVGGSEVASGVFTPAGVREHIEYRAHFLDISANERIVFTYELVLDGRRRSVSLVTIELAQDVGGTHLTYTEQYVFLLLTGDGHDDEAHLKGGIRLQLNGLAAALVHWPAETTARGSPSSP